MRPVIIGIHGLRNKPPRYLLTGWWKKALVEGLVDAGYPLSAMGFHMAYWAYYMHTRSQNPMEKDCQSPQYLWEPYVPGADLGARDPKTFGKHLRTDMHKQLVKIVAGDRGFMNVGVLSNMILHRMFVELDIYYHKELRDQLRRFVPARELIREELARLIRRYRNHPIMILAHSMGSIVAYDVLTHVVPDIPVHTLITFGSPLGIPVVVSKIKQELGLDSHDNVPLPTPASLRHRWLNFSDLDDVTCLSYNIHDRYVPNAHGVRPHDRVVFNNYQCEGVPNPHKSYGYLRTPEMSEAVHRFLAIENAGVFERMKWIFQKPVM